jgi:hypothetical protein
LIPDFSRLSGILGFHRVTSIRPTSAANRAIFSMDIICAGWR